MRRKTLAPVHNRGKLGVTSVYDRRQSCLPAPGPTSEPALSRSSLAFTTRCNSSSTPQNRADTRNIREKEYMERARREVLQYLRSKGYKEPTLERLLVSPTRKEFESVFTFIYEGKIDQKKRFEDELQVAVREILGYPYAESISRAALNAVGSTRAWPDFLALLHWMVRNRVLFEQYLARQQLIRKDGSLQREHLSNTILEFLKDMINKGWSRENLLEVMTQKGDSMVNQKLEEAEIDRAILERNKATYERAKAQPSQYADFLSRLNGIIKEKKATENIMIELCSELTNEQERNVEIMRAYREAEEERDLERNKTLLLEERIHSQSVPFECAQRAANEIRDKKRAIQGAEAKLKEVIARRKGAEEKLRSKRAVLEERNAEINKLKQDGSSPHIPFSKTGGKNAQEIQNTQRENQRKLADTRQGKQREKTMYAQQLEELEDREIKIEAETISHRKNAGMWDAKLEKVKAHWKAEIDNILLGTEQIEADGCELMEKYEGQCTEMNKSIALAEKAYLEEVEYAENGLVQREKENDELRRRAKDFIDAIGEQIFSLKQYCDEWLEEAQVLNKSP